MFPRHYQFLPPLKLDNKTSLFESISDLRKLRNRELNYTKTVKLGENRLKLEPNILSLNFDFLMYFPYVNVRSSTNGYFYAKHQSYSRKKHTCQIYPGLREFDQGLLDLQ